MKLPATGTRALGGRKPAPAGRLVGFERVVAAAAARVPGERAVSEAGRLVVQEPAK